MAVLCDVTPFILVYNDGCFRGAFCVHHQGDGRLRKCRRDNVNVTKLTTAGSVWPSAVTPLVHKCEIWCDVTVGAAFLRSLPPAESGTRPTGCMLWHSASLGYRGCPSALEPQSNGGECVELNLRTSASSWHVA